MPKSFIKNDSIKKIINVRMQSIINKIKSRINVKVRLLSRFSLPIDQINNCRCHKSKIIRSKIPPWKKPIIQSPISYG